MQPSMKGKCFSALSEKASAQSHPALSVTAYGLIARCLLMTGIIPVLNPRACGLFLEFHVYSHLPSMAHVLPDPVSHLEVILVPQELRVRKPK